MILGQCRLTTVIKIYVMLTRTKMVTFKANHLKMALIQT